MKGQSEYNY